MMPTATPLTDFILNEHGNNLAVLIRTGVHSRRWRQRHPEVPFWSLYEDVRAAMPPTQGGNAWDKNALLVALLKLLTTVAQADPALRYSEDDLSWLLHLFDSGEAKPHMWLWLAYASAPDTFVSPAEAAEFSGTSESGWRNQAAAGQIPGAVKVGKQWLLPTSVLRSRGIAVPYLDDAPRDAVPDDDAE